MTEQSPEIVATADISPVSPRPHYNTSPLALPSIQDQAEQLDVISIDQLTSKNPASTAMATEPGSAEPALALADTTDPVSSGVAPGADEDQSLDESIADDDSFDAYGEDANGEAQKNALDADNDDYARIFDSPAQGEAEEADQDVSNKTGESMNSSSASDTLPHQSPVAPVSGDLSSPSVSHADGSLANPAPANPADSTSLLQDASAPPDTTLESAPAQPIHAQAEAASPEDTESKPKDSESKNEDAEMEDDATAVDIQKLVDDITANAATASSTQPPAAVPSSLQDPQSSPMSVNQSTLPPRPALAQEPSNPAAASPDLLQSLQSGSNVPPFSPTGAPMQSTAPISQAVPYPVAAAPGTGSVPQSLPPPPASGYNAAPPFASYPNNAQPYPGAVAASPAAAPSVNDSYNIQQAYDAFLADERRYMSEAKWERFPDGSRIFIGNLSQERVSKKDVFDLFHKYGRLAQISLKSAYGFVQYHNVNDAQAAMENLQGAEIRGRKIHLEYSRAQKKKDRERDGSPDRKGGRDRNRGSDRYDGRDQGGRRSRDDYRPGRSPSPRRDDRRRRDDPYGRNAQPFESLDHGRGRSMSPERFGRQGSDANYRRRSQSPYGRTRPDTDRLDIPRRYGEEIPDVQLLLMQEVQRDFVDWVQRAFYDRGLKTNVMFLNPARAPREAVIQRQVLEGVHAVIELDMRAQTIGRIPLQVFDRSAGINNVRYDQYQDLEPTIAAELVVRTKGQAAPQQPPAYPPNPYGQPYSTPSQQGYPSHLPQRPPPAAAPPVQPDLASLVGQIDNNALQQLLASLQPGQPAMHAPTMPPSAHSPAMANPAAVGANSQIDINALLGHLKNAAGTSGPPAPMPAGPDYGAAGYHQPPGGAMPPGGNGAMPGGADPSAQVATIMQQLARFRQ